MVNKLAYGLLAVLLVLGTLFYNPVETPYANTQEELAADDSYLFYHITALNNAKTAQISAEKGYVELTDYIGHRDFEKRTVRAGEMVVGWGHIPVNYIPRSPDDFYYNSEEDCYRDYIRIVGIDRGIVTCYMLFELRCIDKEGTVCVEKLRHVEYPPLFGYLQLVPPGFVHREIDGIIEQERNAGLFPEEKPWTL